MKSTPNAGAPVSRTVVAALEPGLRDVACRGSGGRGPSPGSCRRRRARRHGSGSPGLSWSIRLRPLGRRDAGCARRRAAPEPGSSSDRPPGHCASSATSRRSAATVAGAVAPPARWCRSRSGSAPGRPGRASIQDREPLGRLGRQRHAAVVAAGQVELEGGNREGDHQPAGADQVGDRPAHDRAATGGSRSPAGPRHETSSMRLRDHPEAVDLAPEHRQQRGQEGRGGDDREQRDQQPPDPHRLHERKGHEEEQREADRDGPAREQGRAPRRLIVVTSASVSHPRSAPTPPGSGRRRASSSRSRSRSRSA